MHRFSRSNSSLCIPRWAGLSAILLLGAACATTPAPSDGAAEIVKAPPPILLGATVELEGPSVRMTATATAATPDKAWSRADARVRAALEVLVAEIGATRTSTAAGEEALAVKERFENVRESIHDTLRERIQVQDKGASEAGYIAEAQIRWNDDDVARSLTGLSTREAEDVMRRHRALVRDLTLQAASVDPDR